MLNWEEDNSSVPLTKPAMATAPLGTVESNLLPNRPMPLPTASASAPSPEITNEAERRVNVADKRIINGKTDVNQLDRKSTRLNSSHIPLSRMPSSA